MEPDQNSPEETAAELCRQAESEQKLDKLLELASKLQRLIDARRRKNAGAGQLRETPPKTAPPDTF